MTGLIPWLIRISDYSPGGVAQDDRQQRVSNSNLGWRRATHGGCGARDQGAGSPAPCGAPYPPYDGAGFVDQRGASTISLAAGTIKDTGQPSQPHGQAL